MAKHAVPETQPRVSYRMCAPTWGVAAGVSPRCRPGAHQRVRQSSIAVVRAWPRCSEPVTFGGGITMTNFSVLLVSFSTVYSTDSPGQLAHEHTQESRDGSSKLGRTSASAPMSPSFSQNSPQHPSTTFGS